MGPPLYPSKQVHVNSLLFMLTLSVPDKGYSRNASCKLCLIFHFFVIVSHPYTTDLLFKPGQVHA